MAQRGASLNYPEENDESQEFESGRLHDIQRYTEEQQIILQHDKFSYSPPSVSYSHQMPYPSRHEPMRSDLNVCRFSSSYSTGQTSGSPRSLPSCLPSAVYQTISDGSLFYPSRSHSLPHSCSPGLMSLDHPQSLHSYHHLSCSYPSSHRQPQHHAAPVHHCRSRPSGPAHYRQMDSCCSDPSDVRLKPKQDGSNITHLSQEQRKVFVTYEADSEEHLKEIIKFVAVLRNNGFDTHMDVFEEQLSSISKIDCMERYLNEKDYLIIIIISPKYYMTVTGFNIGRDDDDDDDDKTSNTVYIHRQLQTEFIQNGCRNYRFIPVLFPGANKSYVPTWLRNTHIYSWPKDHDDILRRLMRVEKYNPPPVGHLPTIVSIPL